MRYPFSSYTDDALGIYSSSAYKVLQNGVTSGRVAWLKGLSITNTHASEGVEINVYDYNTEGANPTTTTQRFSVYVGPVDTVVLDFSGPGIKFITGIILALQTAVGTIGAYDCACWGYEEG